MSLTDEVEDIYRSQQHLYQTNNHNLHSTYSSQHHDNTASSFLDSLSEFFDTGDNLSGISQRTPLPPISSAYPPSQPSQCGDSHGTVGGVQDTVHSVQDIGGYTFSLPDPSDHVVGSNVTDAGINLSLEQLANVRIEGDTTTGTNGEDILSRATRSIMDPSGMTEDYFPGPKRLKSQNTAG